MTRKGLNRVRTIDGELRMWRSELDRLENASRVGGVGSGNLPDPTGNKATRVADVKRIIEGRIAELELARLDAVEFVDSIDDPFLKMVVYYRAVCLMRWNEVANSIGGGNSAESVRQAYSRFVKKLPPE